jgi:hypothetical protein
VTDFVSQEDISKGLRRKQKRIERELLTGNLDGKQRMKFLGSLVGNDYYGGCGCISHPHCFRVILVFSREQRDKKKNLFKQK